MTDKGLYWEEYKTLMSLSEKYFDYLYKVISISCVFISALITLAFRNSINEFEKMFLLKFILPSIIYVFGLLYAYNILVLARCGALSVKMEKKIQKNQVTNKYRIEGWVSYSKQTTKYSFILAYGTIFALYLLAPGFIQLLASKTIQSSFCPCVNYIIGIIPYICFFLYILFQIAIIVEICKYMAQTKQFLRT